MLGRATLRELHAHAPAWRTIGTAHSRARRGVQALDLCDEAALATALEALRPDVIVHTAAERRPDAVEGNPAATQRLNVEVPGRLAAWCREHGSWLIHLSTDYVFDGTRAPYATDAPTCPLNAYGVSKRDAEEAVRGQSPDAAILRVPILYGEVETLAESAVTVVAANLLALKPGATLRAEDWATRYPTHTDDVAVVLRQMVEHRLADPGFGGILHWSGNEPFTKYGMACRMADALGIPRSRLVSDPSPGGGAPRPKDSHLDCTALAALGIGRHTPFAAAIARILRA
jgi:dTDP-4-dehydrorhamnose reductase